jgi:anti-anti-sigma factor
MAIEKIAEDTLLVELPFAGSKMTEELSTVGEMVSDQCTYDIIIDFFNVELISSSNISTLLVLRSMLQNAGHQLVLCNVKVVTKGVFTVAGLHKVFTFANNKEAAFDTLRDSKLSASM